MDNSLYERQIKWRDDAKKKAFANSIRDVDETEKEMTFKPHLYTAPVKKFEGPARELNERSGVDHVRRQVKARKEKENSMQKSSKNSTSLLPVEIEHEYEGHDEHPESLARSIDFDNDIYGIPRDDLIPPSEESLIEMLERERRESHAERVKLIHCIHLQQIELTQRAVASHEKAAEIAKEFARAIEGFEERLLSIENNVHKEITAIKSIAESLSTSSRSPASGFPNSNGADVEKRLAALENGVGLIINKLDAISGSLSTNHRK